MCNASLLLLSFGVMGKNTGGTFQLPTLVHIYWVTRQCTESIPWWCNFPKPLPKTGVTLDGLRTVAFFSGLIQSARRTLLPPPASNPAGEISSFPLSLSLPHRLTFPQLCSVQESEKNGKIPLLRIPLGIGRKE